MAFRKRVIRNLPASREVRATPMFVPFVPPTEINEDTIVAVSPDGSGLDVSAGNMQRWAYNRLAAYPDMLRTLKSLAEPIGHVQDYLANVDADDESGELLNALNKMMEIVDATIAKTQPVA